MVVFDLADRIVVAVPAADLNWRARVRAENRREREAGIEAARDFRRRMDEAYAQAEFPVDQRRVRRGV